MEDVAGLVLAAGSSTRLGRPKALLDFDGRTALGLVLGALRAAGVGRGVVVVGEHAAAIEAAVDPRPLLWARNPDPAAGRTGSIRVGLAATGLDGDVLLWPVDRPLAGESVARALLAARDEAAGCGWLVPVAGGRRGHPILLRRAVLPAIRDADPGASLRDVLRASGLPSREVAAGDEGVHLDLDTEERWGAAVAWWRTRA
jgi:CTP:molybdopterin cytidylyltransferase MocA